MFFSKSFLVTQRWAWLFGFELCLHSRMVFLTSKKPANGVAGKCFFCSLWGIIKECERHKLECMSLPGCTLFCLDLISRWGWGVEDKRVRGYSTQGIWYLQCMEPSWSWYIIIGTTGQVLFQWCWLQGKEWWYRCQELTTTTRVKQR